MSRRPSFQFYPADWRKETGLRLCSMGARGLWAEMLCIMHEGEPYGHLTYQGAKIEAAELASLVGGAPASVRNWLKELDQRNVFSTTADGVIFSRRMVRDERLREARAEIGQANGAKGGQFGHLGAEHGKKGGRPRKETGPGNPDNEPGQKPPKNPHPSSSSSSAEGSEDKSSAQSAPDPVNELFDIGVTLMVAGGASEKQARSLIGKWRKATGSDGEVLTALIEARTKGVSDPIEWLTKRLAGCEYVSPSGYRYKGDAAAVMREAEKRADWGTYWQAKRDVEGRGNISASG